MKKLRLGEFERNSLVVFAITMIANVLSYLYQIVMGNVLTPADYGTVNTLLSLSVVVGVPSGIISALTATYTAKYHAHGETFAIAAFMHGMLRVAAVRCGTSSCVSRNPASRAATSWMSSILTRMTKPKNTGIMRTQTAPAIPMNRRMKNECFDYL